MLTALRFLAIFITLVIGVWKPVWANESLSQEAPSTNIISPAATR
ncbi:MAG TPA: hypothetical protein VNQ76_12785 [Planctomicrobium sp.]|nr:hypothetical protein [Planctomicrobium sp.]